MDKIEIPRRRPSISQITCEMAALGCAAAPSSAPADAIARGEQVRVPVRVREIWAGRLWEGNLWWMPIGVRFFPPIGKGRGGEGKGMDDLSILRAGLGQDQDRGKLAYAYRSTLKIPFRFLF